MAPKTFLYSFAVSAFRFDDPYHRWLFSLCQAANDAELFQRLVNLYTEKIEEGQEPAELTSAEFDAIFHHAVAHTYEALELWFSPPIDARDKVEAEVKEVLALKEEDGIDLTKELSDIDRLWKRKYRTPFRKLRNLLFAHYPSANEDPAHGRALNDYWSTFQSLVALEDVKEYQVGTIITESPDGEHYRHTFVDELHQTFLDKLFPPAYQQHAIEVAGFLGDVKVIFRQFVTPLLLRMLKSEKPNDQYLTEYTWDEPSDGWETV